LPLEFNGNAICLSGFTGTKLKSKVIGKYYPFWWRITSGGERRRNIFPTAIIELNAATGEVFIEDTGQTLLGSAGHALDLKVSQAPQTKNLKVILIEKHPECFRNLTEVIRRRWPELFFEDKEGGNFVNYSNVYLLNTDLEKALDTLEDLEIGNALYFFDPLRSVEFTNVETVARRRMDSFFKTGTEFIIFVFTSDWFIGRTNFIPLPTTIEEQYWTDEQRNTVLEADTLFGDEEWRTHILNNDSVEKREKKLIEEYTKRLRKWFRYILPMPFNPEANQIFHIILCSNFETGVRATRDYYCDTTKNPRYSPSARTYFPRFSRLYPELFVGLKGNRRPLEWKLLWKTIREHENGVCDIDCKDFIEEEPDYVCRNNALTWLEENDYLVPVSITNAWNSQLQQYKLNWETLNLRLDIKPPLQFNPLSPRMFKRK